MRPLARTMQPSSEVKTTKGKILEMAVSALLGLLGCALIVAYASIGRPLWIDEFLHFAFGGFPSTVSAWHAIRHSIGSINFGQTGIYMLLDYWLLKAFGANAVALRFPSILSAGLTLWGGLEFLQKRRYPAIWQFILVVCYLGQATLMYYTGEARPYMALTGGWHWRIEMSTPVVRFRRFFSSFTDPNQEDDCSFGHTVSVHDSGLQRLAIVPSASRANRSPCKRVECGS